MPKKILILTAGKTGGHRSASNALKAAFLSLSPDLEIVDYDSNLLFCGYKGEGGEQGYVTMTTRLRFFWKVFFEFTSLFRPLSNFCLRLAMKDRLRKLLREERPDAVVSLHPCFVGSALPVVKKEGGNIPFFVAVLDPMKHSRLWRDKRADLTFVPTKECQAAFSQEGFPPEVLFLSGFPLSPGTPRREEREGKRRRKLLFVNPSQRGLRATRKLIEAAYPYDVDIDVVAGSDARLKEYLQKRLPPRDGLRIHGYVDDLKERMAASDLLLTKAGPNIMFEAIASGLPLILTGHLPGQEEKNAAYAVSRGYGFAAETPKALGPLLERLLRKEPSLLSEMSRREKECQDLDGARKIAVEIAKRLDKKE